MKAGIVILSGTAAFWAVLALAAAHAALWTYAGAVIVGFAPLALLTTRRIPRRTSQEARRIRRIVALSTLFEAVTILTGTGAAALAGRSDLVICMFAAGVGLHFFPLARWMPAPRYYLTGLAMIAAAAAGLVLPAGFRDTFVASAASAILLASALWLLFSFPRLAARTS